MNNVVQGNAEKMRNGSKSEKLQLDAFLSVVGADEAKALQ